MVRTSAWASVEGEQAGSYRSKLKRAWASDLHGRSRFLPQRTHVGQTAGSDALGTSAEREGILRRSDDHVLIPAVEDDPLRVSFSTMATGYGVPVALT